MTLEELTATFAVVTGSPAENVTLPAGESQAPLPADFKQATDDNWAYFNEFGYEARNDPSVIHPSQVCHPLSA